MNKTRKNFYKRFLAITLVALMLIPLVPINIIKVNADSKFEIDYRALIQLYKDELGVEFDTPTPKFNVKIKDGNTHFVAPTDEEDETPHEKTADMPVIDAIKPGQTFDLEDKSVASPGNKITSWDWQIMYKDENGITYETKQFSIKNPSNIPAPTKPGSVGIYLNAVDNYKIPGAPNHVNASEHGNWRTTDVNEGYFTGNYNMIVKGWYFTGAIIEVRDEVREDVILTEMDLIDTESGKAIETFRRTLDPLDPLNEKKQKVTMSSSHPKDASKLDREITYKVRAKYKFISFIEGKFNIAMPASMTDVQRNLSTTLDKNELLKTKSYDEKALLDGVYDKTGIEISKTNPYARMLNLQEETFEWTLEEIPEDVEKYVKIGGLIPEGFFPKEKNENPNNDWGVLYGNVEKDTNDMGMHKDVKLINNDNEKMKTYRKGEDLRLVFPIEHVDGEDIIGTDNIKNPKAIINIEVKDLEGKVIHKEKIQTDKLLNPEQIMDMPVSKKFKTESNKITACATIDPIHKEKGYNEDPKNDKICITYQAGEVDIGIQPPLKMIGSIDNKYIEPNKNYTLQAQVRHFAGGEAVGANPPKNPRVKVIYTVYDSKGTNLKRETVEASQVLKPGETITMPPSSSFRTYTGMVEACAEIHPDHKELGYNFNPTNDKVCQQFGMVKNYSVKEVKVNPMFVHFSEGESSLEKDASITFTISNESVTNMPLGSNPRVIVRYRGAKIWEGRVMVGPNSSTEMTIPKKVRVYPGDNVFSVEVNPNPGREEEFVPGVSNPYLDNIKSTAMVGKRFEKCETCMEDKIRKRNEWGERWEFSEQYSEIRTGTYMRCGNNGRETYYSNNESKCGCSRYGDSDYDRCRDRGYSYQECRYEDRYRPCVRGRSCYICEQPRIRVSYEYCANTKRNTDTKDVKDYYETYEISDVLFGSKYNADTRNNRFISVKEGGEGLIKAGYGFELKIKTRYRTNRNREEAFPRWFKHSNKPVDSYGYWQGNWSNADSPYYPSQRGDRGYCDSAQKNPMPINPTWSPNKVYLEMPYTGGKDSKGVVTNVCYILRETAIVGRWNNHEKTFELPPRKTSSGKTERKIYINEKARPNNKSGRRIYPVKITTPRPDNPADRFFGHDPGRYQIPISSYFEKKRGTYLHDCDEFFIIILPQDDIKSHIIQ